MLSLFANLDYLKTANAVLFWKQNLTVLPMFIPVCLVRRLACQAEAVE